MCGIVGYTGEKQALSILLDGLEKLEYRGYDSAGIAVYDESEGTNVIKSKGRLIALRQKVNDRGRLEGKCGIGHTRWATHGIPSEENAHPHYSDDKNVIAVHNGIIENYAELKEKLTKEGYAFYSQTDTEVAVKLIDYYMKKYGQGPLDALSRMMLRVSGSYAIAVMLMEYPGEIFAVRKDSPMIIGVSDGETYLASDIPAILNYTDTVYYVGNCEIAHLKKGSVEFYNIDREAINKTPTKIDWEIESTDRKGYQHFMLKEIHEQPKAVKDTLDSVIKEGKIDYKVLGIQESEIQKTDSVCIVGCGSAYHAGVAIQYVMEDLCRIPVRVELASEFRYRKPVMSSNTLVIVISQSGETADSLAALRMAGKLGYRTHAIVNVYGSTIAREADSVFYTSAGPEIAVATTKAYLTQLIAGYLTAVAFAAVKGTVNEAKTTEYLSELNSIPEKIVSILSDKERIQWFASKYSGASDVFFIGRGTDYAISMEGSLKMKEISYIHSEAYAAGELKHGTISLVEKGTLVVSVVTQPELFDKMISNMSEVKSRGGYVMGLTGKGNYEIEDTADFTVYIPQTDPHFAAALAVVPLQLMGYYISVAKGIDVDKPRNLAKSVTVE